MKTVQTMKGHSNYQDCSALRPHIPHSSYGTYVTLAPKVLVFPVFVQVSLRHAPRFPSGGSENSKGPWFQEQGCKLIQDPGPSLGTEK